MSGYIDENQGSHSGNNRDLWHLAACCEIYNESISISS